MEKVNVVAFLKEQVVHLEKTIEIIKEKGKDLAHPWYRDILERLEKQKKEFKEALEKLKVLQR